MFLRILNSGSNGNATIFHTDKHDECLLLDCGVSYVTKHIKDYNVIGVLVTHCHSDHCSKIKYIEDIDIYGTVPELNDQRVLKMYDMVEKIPKFKYVEYKRWIDIGPYHVLPLPAMHDTPRPCHYLITDGYETIFYGCDTSSLQHNLNKYLKWCDTIMLECDYDEVAMQTDMIDGHTVDYVYEDDLKMRVRNTHCSVQYIQKRMSKYFRKARIILGHISQVYNSQRNVSNKIKDCLVVDRTDCPVNIDDCKINL